MTNINHAEFARLSAQVGKLLKAVPAEAPGVRAQLKDVFAAAKTNVARRNYFDVVSDMLTLTSFVDEYGYWLIAEVEGTDVQFNRLIGSVEAAGDDEGEGA